MFQFYEVNVNLVMQKHCKTHEKNKGVVIHQNSHIPAEGLRWPNILLSLISQLFSCPSEGDLTDLLKAALCVRPKVADLRYTIEQTI